MMPRQMGHISHSVSQSKMHASSSRILLDVPCKVCRDHSSGKHYGIYACDGCAGFFKRSIRRNRQYACKAKAEGGCMVDKTHRNQCRSCRLAKCIQAGMNRDAVQHERGPRNSTLRRQMALYYGGKEAEIMSAMVTPPTAAALDLVLPKPAPEPRVTVAAPTAHHPVAHHPVYTSIGLGKLGGLAPPARDDHHHHHHNHHHHHHRHDHPQHPAKRARLAASPDFPALQVPSTQAPLPQLPLRFPISIGESMCEQAARLLFLNVTWARELNANSGLCIEDQMTVIEASWRELFLLAAAQCVPSLDPTPLVPPGPQSLGLAVEVARFREALLAFGSLGLDAHEYSCVKAVVLYKAGLDCSESVPSSRSSNGSASPGASRLRDAAAVVRLRDGAQTALGAKMAATSSFGAVRFSKLILMLPMLRTVSAHAIEELFFRKTIGVTPMEKIICDVYSKAC